MRQAAIEGIGGGDEPAATARRHGVSLLSVSDIFLRFRPARCIQALATTLGKQEITELLALEELELQRKATGEAIWNGLGALMRIGKMKKLGSVRTL